MFSAFISDQDCLYLYLILTHLYHLDYINLIFSNLNFYLIESFLTLIIMSSLISLIFFIVLLIFTILILLKVFVNINTITNHSILIILNLLIPMRIPFFYKLSLKYASVDNFKRKSFFLLIYFID